MTRLTGRFDGRAVVLDDPQAIALPPETPVELVIVRVPGQADVRIPDAEARLKALEEFREASREFWSRQTSSAPAEPPAKRWTRDELYDEIV